MCFAVKILKSKLATRCKRNNANEELFYCLLLVCLRSSLVSQWVFLEARDAQVTGKLKREEHKKEQPTNYYQIKRPKNAAIKSFLFCVQIRPFFLLLPNKGDSSSHARYWPENAVSPFEEKKWSLCSENHRFFSLYFLLTPIFILFLQGWSIAIHHHRRCTITTTMKMCFQEHYFVLNVSSCLLLCHLLPS